MALTTRTDDPPPEGRVGRGVARSPATKDRRTAVSPFRALPELHPHEAKIGTASKWGDSFIVKWRNLAVEPVLSFKMIFCFDVCF